MPYRRHTLLLALLCCLPWLPLVAVAQTDLPPVLMGQPIAGDPTFPHPVPDTIRGLHCFPLVYDFDYFDEDSGSGPVVFALEPGDPGSIDADGVYTFVPSLANVGQQLEITVSVCRPSNNCTEATIRVVVDNDAPRIENLCGAVITTTAGATEQIPLTIEESCPGDPLDLFIVSSGGLNNSPTVNDATQLLTIPTTGSDFGLYTIKVGATDTKDTSFCTLQLNIPGGNAIALDTVLGLEAGVMQGGTTAEMRFRITVDAAISSYLTGYSNGFRIYSPDGAQWDTVSHRYLSPWPLGTPDGYDNTALARFGVDGAGDDTVTFAGLVFFSDRGALPGYDSVAWSIAVRPSQTLANDGRTICIDTVRMFPPMNIWLWNDSTLTGYAPTWAGPYCFTISSESCCRGMTGNTNNDAGDVVSLTDLTLLVNHLFVTFDPLGCRPEGNTNGDPNCDLTLTDLTQLVNHLFVTFMPLADCGQFDESACY